MSDKELLELAAKAHGSLHYEDELGLWIVIEGDGGRGKWWNPLTDDGDALRLAVKLNLHVCIDAESAGAITAEWDFDDGGFARHCIEEFSNDAADDCAAARRAIVRAAAEIGRQMG